MADAFAIVAQDPEGIAKIEPVLTLLETKGWDRLVAALRAVLAGARDPEALAEAQSLDREDYLILTKLLGALPAPRLRRGRLTGGPGSEVVNNPRP